MDKFEQVEMPPIAKLGNPNDRIIARLQEVLSGWMTTGRMPDEVGVLSSGEYRALMVAAGREDLLGSSPVRDFLLLDDWLQRWVMETRGWNSLIGTRVGA